MIISPPSYHESLAVAVVLVLICLLVLYELLSEERKNETKGLLLASILIFLSVFVLIIIHRLEALV